MRVDSYNTGQKEVLPLILLYGDTFIDKQRHRLITLFEYFAMN